MHNVTILKIIYIIHESKQEIAMVVEGEVLVSHRHCVLSIGLHNLVDLHLVSVQVVLPDIQEDVPLLHYIMKSCLVSGFSIQSSLLCYWIFLF